jgi:hypothetical protein
MMEEYVNSGNIVLQDMAQKVAYAQQIFQENKQATSMPRQQEKLLKYHNNHG